MSFGGKLLFFVESTLVGFGKGSSRLNKLFWEAHVGFDRKFGEEICKLIF